MDAGLNVPLLTPLRRIPTPKGDVLHGMKAADPGYDGFGEVYLSIVLQNAVKGWKRHARMTLNLVCIAGEVQFVVYRDGWSQGDASVLDTSLSPGRPELYRRLTVPPKFWVGFRGVGAGDNLVLNIANLGHDPDEAETVSLDCFPWPAATGS